MYISYDVVLRTPVNTKTYVNIKSKTESGVLFISYAAISDSKALKFNNFYFSFLIIEREKKSS